LKYVSTLGQSPSTDFRAALFRGLAPDGSLYVPERLPRLSESFIDTLPGRSFHDIVRTIGAVNVGAEHGLHGYDAISSEQILRWDPEWIVTGSAKGKSVETLQRLLDDPAVQLTTAARKGQILVLESHVFLPMSPFTVLLLDALSESIYPAPSKAGI